MFHSFSKRIKLFSWCGLFFRDFEGKYISVKQVNTVKMKKFKLIIVNTDLSEFVYPNLP